MKKILLLMVMCVLGLFGTLRAQENSFSYDFEDGTLTGWRVYQGSYATGDNWQVVDGKGQDGSKGIYSASCVAAPGGWGGVEYTPNNYIVTVEAYTINATSELSFNLGNQTIYGVPSEDKLDVVVSEDGSSFTTVVWSGNGANTGELIIPLADHAGKTLYIGFRHYITSSYGDGEIILDNIVLSSEQAGNEEEPNEGETTFAMNFDDGTFAGWRTFDAPDAYCLGWQISPDDAYLGSFYLGTDGSDCAVSVSANPIFGDMYKPNSYLVTENAYQITSTSVLSWNVKSPFATSAEYYEVVVSEDNEDFTSIWSEESPNLDAMVAKEVNLSQYAGKTLYIGFRHYRETSSSNAGFLCIDDVVLSTSGSGEEEPQVPATPANLVAQATGETTIVLTWDAVDGATGYKVYDEEDVIAETNETTYTVEGLTAATNYCFIVTAVNEVGESYASAQACDTTEEPEPNTGTLITIGENGATTSNSLPINTYYNYSVSQQIYTAAEMQSVAGDITKMAFYSTDSYTYTRNLSVYMLNTDQEIFEGQGSMHPITNGDLVFQGELTTPGAGQWFEIELQNAFSYAGGNLLVCVIDGTGNYENRLNFKTFDVDLDYGDQGRGYSIEASNDYDPYNIETLSNVWGVLDNSRNTVQFTIVSEPGLSVNPKDGINLGTIQLGNYWPEKAEASVNVTVGAIERTVTSITCDNDFFVLSEIDMTASPIKFNVSYDKDAADGTYNGTLTITAAEGDVLEVPMTATVYSPVEPDVFELAREISFSNNTYTDAPDFATLHDDYVLPNESANSVAPDAVYVFTLDSEKVLKTSVEGQGGFHAIYRADSIGNGKGPHAGNNYYGEEVILSTTLSYDFEDGSLADFTIQNLDEYPDYCWYIEDGKLISCSFDSWGEYGTDSWGTMDQADERVITNEAYTITPYTVLTLDMQRAGAQSYQDLIVEVTKDGENFTALGTVSVDPEWVEDPYNKPLFPQLFDENGNYITFRRVNLGANFIAAGLEYGEYQISLHAVNDGCEKLIIDNLALTERAGVYEAGDYYMVAAAKETFTVNVELSNPPGEEPNPDALYRLVSKVTDYSQEVYTYASDKGTKVVTVEADGLVETLEYDDNGVLLGYVAKSGEEVMSEVGYIYDENGVLTGFAESTMMWNGSIYTEEYTFEYVDGKVVSVNSPEFKYEFTYNAEGLVTEKTSYYTYEDGSQDVDSKEIYTYENGRLVKREYCYPDWNTGELFAEEETNYSYDANGNCISEEIFFLTYEGTEVIKDPYKVVEYEHNTAVAYENVFYFSYPHLAIINMAQPAHANIILSENSHYCYMDGDELVEHSFTEMAYNYEEYEPEGMEEEKPQAPANVTAEATSSNTILVSWDAVPGAMYYGIYKDGEWAVAVFDTSYEFEGLQMETEYCFTVVTITEVDENYVMSEYSDPSEEACATTEASTVLPPANVTAEATGANSILLSWDAVDGAIYYGIYQGDYYLGALPAETLSYEFTGLNPETEYCFAVATISGVEDDVVTEYSEPSEEACATTQNVGVDEFSTAFNVYPNPVNDVLFVESGVNVEQVTIYNVTGVMVYSEECTSNNVQINVSDLEAGVYIIKVRTENNEVINRFVKK